MSLVCAVIRNGSDWGQHFCLVLQAVRGQSAGNVSGLLPVQLLLPLRVDRVCAFQALAIKAISTWIVQDIVPDGSRTDRSALSQQ
jgi:hypothetical protein